MTHASNCVISAYDTFRKTLCLRSSLCNSERCGDQADQKQVGPEHDILGGSYKRVEKGWRDLDRFLLPGSGNRETTVYIYVCGCQLTTPPCTGPPRHRVVKHKFCVTTVFNLVLLGQKGWFVIAMRWSCIFLSSLTGSFVYLVGVLPTCRKGWISRRDVAGQNPNNVRQA